MYFFAFSIKKPVTNPIGKMIAFASCWIDESARDKARIRAEEMKAEEGWSSEAIIEDHVVTRLDYSPTDDNLDYYEQALQDGEVMVIYLAGPRGKLGIVT